MSVQNIQGYIILVNDQPAVIKNTLFNNWFYTEFDTALAYAKKWLGLNQNDLPENWQGERFHYFTGSIHCSIEIKFSPGIEL